jgi:serine/threonine protein kinase
MRNQFVEQSTRKEASRIQDGKFITIYTVSTAEFRYLALTLAEQLRGFESIPVLTDLKVFATSPVYYRYGGFLPHYLFDAEGDPIYAIYNTQKKLTPDQRIAGGALPFDRSDPLTDARNWRQDLSKITVTQSDRQTDSFFAKYKFTSVLSFSNYGGVYTLLNKKTGETAVTKEARAFIGSEKAKNTMSARKIRRQEWKMLNKLADVSGIPKPIEYVKTDISDFLIEQQVDGVTLATYRRRNPLYWAEPTETEFNLYAKKVTGIFDQLWKIMNCVHAHHVVLNDVKPENIVITPNDSPFFIDLDSARTIGQDPRTLPALFSWGYSDMTPLSRYTTAADYEGLARCLLEMMISRVHEFNLGIESEIQSLQFLQKVTQAWGDIPDALIELMEHKTDAVDHLHHALKKTISQSVDRLSILSIPNVNAKQQYAAGPEHQHGVQTYHLLLKTAQRMIQQNKFPLTPYLNNNLANFAYGLGGLTYGSHFLGISTAALDEKFHCALITATRSKNVAPFSLDRGQLGSLMTHFELFRDTWSQAKLNGLFKRFFQMDSHQLSLLSGVAGVGQCAIWMFIITKDERYQRIAERALQEVLARPEPSSQYGLGYGNSGVALFLTHYATEFNRTNLFPTALKYWLVDYYHGTITNSSRVRGVVAGKHQQTPYIYIVHGAAGLIQSGLQILRNMPNQELDQGIQRLSRSLLVPSTVNVGYLYGTSGLVSTLITLESQYSQPKFKLAEKTLLNSIFSSGLRTNDEMFLPSDANVNVGLDYGAGIIGDLLTMQKVFSNQPAEFDPLFK